jgi:hypothetical protein
MDNRKGIAGEIKNFELYKVSKCINKVEENRENGKGYQMQP